MKRGIVNGFDGITEKETGSFQSNSSNPCQVKNFKILEIFMIW